MHCAFIWGARVAQWWEHSPPTNVARVWILASAPYVRWMCCWFSPLLREVFLRVLQFSALLKNRHFQIPIRSGTHGHISTSSYELLSALWVNKLQNYKIHLSLRIKRWPPWKRASAETWFKWLWSKRSVIRISHGSFFSGWDESQSVGKVPNASGTRVAELKFLTKAFDGGCCAETLSWHLSFIFITVCPNYFISM